MLGLQFKILFWFDPKLSRFSQLTFRWVGRGGGFKNVRQFIGVGSRINFNQSDGCVFFVFSMFCGGESGGGERRRVG